MPLDQALKSCDTVQQKQDMDKLCRSVEFIFFRYPN